MVKYRVERHWLCTVDADDYDEAFDKALKLYLKDYGIEVADIQAIRGSLKASVVEDE